MRKTRMKVIFFIIFVVVATFCVSLTLESTDVHVDYHALKLHPTHIREKYIQLCHEIARESDELSQSRQNPATTHARKYLLYEIDNGFRDLFSAGIGHIRYALECYFYEAIETKRFAVIPDSQNVGEHTNRGIRVPRVPLDAYFDLRDFPCVMTWTDFARRMNLSQACQSYTPETYVSTECVTELTLRTANRVQIVSQRERVVAHLPPLLTRHLHEERVYRDSDIIVRKDFRLDPSRENFLHGDEPDWHWWQVCTPIQKSQVDQINLIHSNPLFNDLAKSLLNRLPDRIQQSSQTTTQQLENDRNAFHYISTNTPSIQSNSEQNHQPPPLPSHQRQLEQEKETEEYMLRANEYIFVHVRMLTNPLSLAAPAADNRRYARDRLSPRAILHELELCHVPANFTLFVASDDPRVTFLIDLYGVLGRKYRVVMLHDYTLYIRARVEPSVTPAQRADAHAQSVRFFNFHFLSKGLSETEGFQAIREAVLLNNNFEFAIEMALAAHARRQFCTNKKYCMPLQPPMSSNPPNYNINDNIYNNTQGACKWYLLD